MSHDQLAIMKLCIDNSRILTRCVLSLQLILQGTVVHSLIQSESTETNWVFLDGGVPILIEVMKRHIDNGKLMQYVCQIIEDLADYNGTKSILQVERLQAVQWKVEC